MQRWIWKNLKRRMIMKKRWILALAIAGALAMTAACGGKEEAETNEAPVETETQTQESKSKVVKLGNYKGVKAEAVSTEVTEEELQAEIDALLNFYPATKPVEGKTVIEEGDTVNIDFVGRMDGEPFEGGSSQDQGYDLTIGSGSFIAGFEEGLIGKEIGNTYDLNLTFPDPYKVNPEMSGKEVVFEVTVHEIVEYVDAEWTDEFVAKYTEYDSIEAYREGTKALLETEKVQNQPSEWENRVIQAVAADTEFEFDQEEIELIKTNIVQEYEMYASLYGVEMAEFLKYYMNGISEEEFYQQAAERAENQLKSQLVIEAIREAEQITVTEEEYQEGLKDLAEQYGAESPEAFEEQYGRETVEDGLIFDKTVDFVVEQAVEI
jgi:trigger factor